MDWLKPKRRRPGRPLGISLLILGILFPSFAQGQESESQPTDPPVIETLVLPPSTDSAPEKTTTEPCDSCPPSPVPVDPCLECEGEEPFDWSKVPPVFPLQRLGWFIIPPGGDGYYSLLDVWQDNYREKPIKLPYGATSLNATSFFNYDFRYLEDPNNQQTDWADFYKRVHIGDEWLFSTGGELRYRYHNELNSRLTGVNNFYDLFRARVYGDLWYLDKVRAFIGFIFADTYNNDIPPLPIDDTGADLLNAFLELKVGELHDAPIYLRGGRQQITLGSQRLISGLDWANTLRTFQGVRAYRHSPEFDMDLFWVQPVIPNPTQFDSVASQVDFMGLWTTFKPRKGSGLDLYLLNLDTEVPAVRGNVATLGGRYYGDIDGRLLYDMEGMTQWGERAGLTISAQAATGGLGWRFKQLPMNPILWAYYDYASGDPDPTDGNSNTFNQLFPFGHYYLGHLDLVGRQNIHDLNFQFSVNPTPWIVALMQFHSFELDTARDALYNAAGVPIRRDPTGAAGTDVGNEIDFLVNFRLSQHHNLLFGYAKLFAGDFLRDTGVNTSPEFFYTQYSFRW